MTQERQLDLPLPPRVRVRLADEDFPAERSPWETHEYPPIQGWWEVRNRQTSVFLGRWWWDGDSRWNCDMRTALVRSMDMQQFRKQGYEWRGLRDPSPDIYPCPPYSSSVLLPVAHRANVALRTLHAITTPKPRERVRIDQE